MSAEATSLSWILASRQPRQLAGFYAELLNTSVRSGLAEHHWIVPLGTSGTLQIYTPSRNRPWPSSGSVLAPCLQRQVEVRRDAIVVGDAIDKRVVHFRPIDR